MADGDEAELLDEISEPMKAKIASASPLLRVAAFVYDFVMCD
jgi:hypothetical protein